LRPSVQDNTHFQPKFSYVVQPTRLRTTLLTSKIVFKLNLSVKMVRGSPSLSEADAIGLVSILGLEITKNNSGLVVALTVDFEGLVEDKRISNRAYASY
jgi:hypothetical protein